MRNTRQYVDNPLVVRVTRGGCPTSKHCVWIVFAPLTQWGGACPKHSSSIVSTTVFFSLSLSPPWIFHQFLQKSRPTPTIYFSFIFSPCHFDYYFFILNCPWHYNFFFYFTLYHLLNYNNLSHYICFFNCTPCDFYYFKFSYRSLNCYFFYFGPFLFLKKFIIFRFFSIKFYFYFIFILFLLFFLLLQVFLI